MSRRHLLASVLGSVLATGLLAGAAPLLAAPASAATVPTVPTVPTGPDVSRWQHLSPLDWARVRSSGAAFAIVKATEGPSTTNTWFSRDYAAVRANGMVRGSYHFARPALPVSTARTQARHYVDVLGTTRAAGALPPVLDLEESGGLSPGDLVTWAQTFLDEVHALTGRTPAVYTYPYFWQTALADSAAFRRFPLWVASYGTTRPPSIGGWPTWTLWQYTDASRTAGIAGGVDSSRFSTATGTLASFANGVPRSSWPVARPAAPVRVSASATGTTVQVRWVPGDDGGARTTAFRVLASSGGSTTVSGSASSATVSGLPAGRQVSFRVVPVNPAGTGATSVASPTVTTAVPTTLSSTLSPSTVLTGRSTTLTTRLTRSGGTALAARALRVYQRPAGTTTWTFAASLRTDATGRAHWTSRPSRTTAVQVRYAGSAVERPATSTRTAVLAPVVTAQLAAAAVRLGTSTALRGALRPAFPGQLVYRQGYYSGAWHTWAGTRTSATGSYAFAVKPTVRAVNTYRVWVPASSTHSAAASPTVLLRVS